LTEWNDSALKEAFYEALSDDVKDGLMYAERPETLRDFYDLAIRIDRRIQERRREKQVGRHARGPFVTAPDRRRPPPPPSALPDVVPMEVDSVHIDDKPRRRTPPPGTSSPSPS
jgi:hypothetical protein